MPLKSLNQGLFVCIIAGCLFAGCHNAPVTQNNLNVSQGVHNTYSVSNDTSLNSADKNAVEGLNVFKYKDGVIKAKGYCKAGKKDGEWQSFYEDGKLRSDEFFTNGIKDGKETVWYNNGEKMYEGENKDGKPIGTWSYWNDKGGLIRTSDYNKKSPNTAL